MAQTFMLGERYALARLPHGSGGMGQVYLGRDLTLDREVAVKFVRFRNGYDKKLVQRFYREARLTASLEHPGVPAVHDLGQHEGTPYLVMQFVRGITLSDLVAEQGPLPLGWVAAVGSQICSVLAPAHPAGLVHRDLKPLNVMLERDGWVKVLDFGLALDAAEPVRLTSSGDPTPGTPAYMAPEQLTRGESSPATDLYALGCTLYEMLTGEPPFTQTSTFSVMTAHASVVPVPVREARPDVPEVVEAMVAALLAKNPAERPADAGAALRVLLPHADGAAPLAGVVDPAAGGEPRHGFARAVSALFGDARDRSAPSPTRVTPVPSPVVVDQEALLTAQGQLADRAFADGDFVTAAAVYQQLAEAVEAASSPGDDLRLDYAMKAGSCLALAGQSNIALARLLALLDDERSRRGLNDDRILRLRHQIALLEWSLGQADAARLGLGDLLAHLDRLHGADHPLTRKVRADLDRVSR